MKTNNIFQCSLLKFAGVFFAVVVLTSYVQSEDCGLILLDVSFTDPNFAKDYIFSLGNIGQNNVIIETNTGVVFNGETGAIMGNLPYSLYFGDAITEPGIRKV